jgi:predicted PhzF superfamily epimerase YddE/YHI9
MAVQLHIVDAFTDAPFGGNQAGVVLLDGRTRDDAWMQSVAAELGFSETAFTPGTAVSEPRPLRWFTPTTEVDLCGHATLATAHVLGGDQRFGTRSGELRCVAAPDGWVEMDFPADPPLPIDGDTVAAAVAGLTVTSVGRGVSDVLVEVAYAAEVRAFVPDFAALAAVPARGVIVTAAGDRAGVDFVSRCFYPATGVPEDPVTGSAHTTLACWWAGRLGREELVGEQASARGGVVRVVMRGDRVGLAGRAVTVSRGELLV